MHGVQLNDRKISTDLMFMLDLSETIDQLAMANSVRWNSHALKRQDGHVLDKNNIEKVWHGVNLMSGYKSMH